MINIYVGNLPYATTEDELANLFGAFGAVVNVTLISDRQTGRPRGFGFVEMADHAQGTQAIEQISGELFNDRHLTVNEARNRQQSNASTSAQASDAPSPRSAPPEGSFGQVGGGYTNSLLKKDEA